MRGEVVRRGRWTGMMGVASAMAIAMAAGTPRTALAQVPPAQPPKEVAPAGAQDATRASFKHVDEEHNMGTILQTERPEFDFEFTNDGGSELEIVKVLPSCGCTVAEMAKKKYAPGESGKIHVKYDPSGKIGPQNKHITVETNDPKHQTVILRFTANVEPAVVVEPRIINFGQVNKGQEGKVIVEVSGRPDDFEATFATVQRGELMTVKKLDDKPVSVEAAGKTLHRTRFEITLKAGSNVGKIVDLLTIRTTDPREPIVNCSVAGTILGDLGTEPAVLAFGAVQPDTEFSGQMRLKSRSKTAFKIESIDVKQPNAGDVKVSYEPDANGAPGEYVLKATGKSPQVKNASVPLTGTIVVHTDVEGERTIEIPYALQIRMAPRQPVARPPGTRPTAPAAPGTAPAPTPGPGGKQ